MPGMERGEDRFLVFTERGTREADMCRELPSRTWDPSRTAWDVPLVRENILALDAMGWLPEDWDEDPEDFPSVVQISKKGRSSVLVVSPPSPKYVSGCKGIPGRRLWKPDAGGWVVQATSRNVEYLLETFPEADWVDGAEEYVEKLQSQEEERAELERRREEGGTTGGYQFHPDFPPYEHQERAFSLGRDMPAFAYLMEMGTGKTRVVVDEVIHYTARGKIHGALIVCPNSIKDPWAEEVERMTPPWATSEVQVWESSMGKRDREELDAWVSAPKDGKVARFLVMNVEALSHKKGREYAEHFLLTRGPCLMAVDESSRIKNPSAKRTKAVLALGEMAAYRRILSGTPITQGPLDYFSQFKFLDPDIMGFRSYYAFRNHFAEMGGFEGKEVVGYRNLDELQELVAPYSYRVLRRECMDLPPKIHEKRYVDLNRDQERLYREMADKMVADLEGRKVTATIVLTQMMRLQQIVGGFLPPEPVDPWAGEDAVTEEEPTVIPGTNPKVQALLEVAEEAPGKMIVWARFRAELGLISQSLRDAFGRDSVAEFHGGVSTEERTRGRLAFQDPDSPVRFFVGQTETGGLGITLTEAQTVVYFSNSFSLESRLQSEDRAHRAGQERTVTYVDLVARATLDTKVLDALRSKKNMADMVTGDTLVSWI